MHREVMRVNIGQKLSQSLEEKMFQSPTLSMSQIKDARLFNENKTAVLELVKDNINFLEIGVAAGDTSEFICKNKKVINACLVDPYNDIDFYSYRYNIPPRYTPDKHFDFVYNRISPLVSGQVKLLQGFSEDLLPIDSMFFDYVYIDGNHSYESVYSDLGNSAKMLNEDGIICIDDYVNHMVDGSLGTISVYGVVRAVNDFLTKNKNFKVIGYAINPVAPSIFIQRFPVV
jgi:hypothetical protein